MSPRTADPAVRDALVEAAAEIIAGHEPLTTRRLAAHVGASTMAVYTHFGSLEEVRRAVRRQGFDRLRDNLARAGKTTDPIADLAVLGWAYTVTGLTNPNLYRVMFMEVPLDDEDQLVGLDTFETLVAAVQRAMDAGRFRPGDAWDVATQKWAMVHGTVALHLAGMIDRDRVLQMGPATVDVMFAAYGDDPAATKRSMAAATRRIRKIDWGVEVPNLVASAERGA